MHAIVNVLRFRLGFPFGQSELKSQATPLTQRAVCSLSVPNGASVRPKLAFPSVFSVASLPLPISTLCWRYGPHPERLRKPPSPASQPDAALPPPDSLSLPAVAFEEPRAGGDSLPASCFICGPLAFLSNSDFNQFVIMRLRLSRRRLRVLRVRAHAQNRSDVSLL